MKTDSRHTTAARLTAFALCLGTVAVLQAQTPQPGQPGWPHGQPGQPAWGQTTQPGQPATAPTHGMPGATFNQVELITPQSEAFTLENLSGKSVRTSNQEELGTLEDFLIDPQSGRVHFALVPSGAGQAGQTYRLVPLGAVQTSDPQQGLTLRIDRNQWQRVGTLTEERLQGSISIDQSHQQRLAQEFGIPEHALTQGQGGFDNLVRASTLKGREIRSGQEQFGQIEDVVIDLNNRLAAPVLKPSEGFAATEPKFLVPFERLQLDAHGQGAITTTLTRSDFQQAQSGLSPTGRMFGMAHGDVSSAMSAVQQMLQRDPTLGAGVHVMSESKLVLRGSVDSEQKKSQIEQMARQAAPGVQIENQLIVQNR
jgi:sporulation protein YlmC with PRC-barrel domain